MSKLNLQINLFYYIIFIAFINLGACKSDGKTSTVSETTSSELGEKKDFIKKDPCSFLNEETVASLIGNTAEEINIRAGQSQNEFARSCFFKWSTADFPNAGMLVQILKNPVEDEYSEWAFMFIETKKSMGETALSDPNNPIKYTTLPDIGEQACYNLAQSKTYFRVGETVYLVALNGVDEDKRLDLMKNVAREVIKGI